MRSGLYLLSVGSFVKLSTTWATNYIMNVISDKETGGTNRSKTSAPITTLSDQSSRQTRAQFQAEWRECAKCRDSIE